MGGLNAVAIKISPGLQVRFYEGDGLSGTWSSFDARSNPNACISLRTFPGASSFEILANDYLTYSPIN